jgi:glutamate-ammonia-ligase adenylyltransferase
MEKMSADNEIPLDPAFLASLGVRDAGQAAANLDAIYARLGSGDLERLRPMLLPSLRRVADPDMALNNLERFLSELTPVTLFGEGLQTYPPALTSLLALFGASRFLAAHCIATAAETFRLLCNPLYLAYPAEKAMLEDRLMTALQGLSRDEDLLRSLRRFRKMEMLRIALRDLLELASLSETVGELTNLAEVCIQAAYEWFDEDLTRKHGRPLIMREDGTSTPAGFAVIGMGKLGGQELNFSSDVDLMYVYTADGETEGAPGPDGSLVNRITNHQYFVKLAEKLSAAVGQNTADGFVFRVDLRLRPEGQRGPLAQSLGGYEIYYESWGQTWERSALIKARFVAGDEAVGREFLVRITPFVYRKYLDFSAIAEIREMKQKINREVQQKGRTQRDVKLGYGGIREIEFLVQALQLIYGGRDRALRERGTMRALHRLAQKGLLTYQEVSDLMKAYVFLRTVEHRIQMLNDLQTQTLPSGNEELRVLARRTGYFDAGKEAQALLNAYADHTRLVRTIYDNLLGQTAEAPEESQVQADVAILLDPAAAEQDAIDVLARSGFREPSRAFRNIALLREGEAFVHQTPRSRRVFNELFPLLFQEITGSPDPDMAMNHLESYLAAQGSWDAFQTFIRQDARLLRLLVSVLGNSEYFSRLLIRTPSLLEDLLEGSPGGASALRLQEGIAAMLVKSGSLSEKLDALRRFKHREELRIGMADLAGEVPLPAVCRGLSRLADACLTASLKLAATETASRYGGCRSPEGLAVMGVGKLGGRELIYGSDLDILFVFDESLAGAPPPGGTVSEYFSRIAEKTISYLTTMTREGAAYRIDTRLRPTGSKGPLVQSIEAFRAYFGGQAETWERQALVNTRFVAGDRAVGTALTGTLRELLFREEDPAALASAVRAMRRRMEEELGREDGKQYNIKQGAGGLVDIEFLVQYLLLLHGHQRRTLRVPGALNALRALRRERLLDPDDADMLCSSYLFLRRLESRMRVVANQSKSSLSREPETLGTLAKRMGYADTDGGAGMALLADYEQLRIRVRAMFERVVGEKG